MTMPTLRDHLRLLLAATLLTGTALAANAQTAAPDFFLGTAIAASEGRRTIEIGPGTRWVNVLQYESVRFVVGGQSFGWRFDGPGSRGMDLQSIAPAGLVTRSIRVYVQHVPEFAPRPF